MSSTADDTGSTTTEPQRRGPGKPKGHPKPPGSGRKPGTPNRRTQEAAEAMRPLLPKAKRALLALLMADDAELRLKAASLCFAYVYGKPTERREVSGPEGGPIEKRSETTIEDTRLNAGLRVAALLNQPLRVAGRDLYVPKEMVEALPPPAGGETAALPPTPEGIDPMFDVARRLAFLHGQAERDLAAAAVEFGIVAPPKEQE